MLIRVKLSNVLIESQCEFSEQRAFVSRKIGLTLHRQTIMTADQLTVEDSLSLFLVKL